MSSSPRLVLDNSAIKRCSWLLKFFFSFIHLFSCIFNNLTFALGRASQHLFGNDKCKNIRRRFRCNANEIRSWQNSKIDWLPKLSLDMRHGFIRPKQYHSSIHISNCSPITWSSKHRWMNTYCDCIGKVEDIARINRAIIYSRNLFWLLLNMEQSWKRTESIVFRGSRSWDVILVWNVEAWILVYRRNFKILQLWLTFFAQRINGVR